MYCTMIDDRLYSYCSTFHCDIYSILEKVIKHKGSEREIYFCYASIFLCM